jgi:hypothetical protein
MKSLGCHRKACYFQSASALAPTLESDSTFTGLLFQTAPTFNSLEWLLFLERDQFHLVYAGGLFLKINQPAFSMCENLPAYVYGNSSLNYVCLRAQNRQRT